MAGALLLVGLLGCAAAQEQDKELAPPASYVESVAAWYDGEHDRAIGGFRRLLAENPENDRARRDLLILLREAGRTEEAVAVAEELPANDPEIPFTLLLAGEEERLRDHRFTAAAKTPELTARQRLLEAAGAALLGYTEVAVERADLAMSLVDHLPYALLLKGVVELRRGDAASAVPLLEGALRQDRNLTEALVPLAGAKRAVGEEEEAYRLLRRAEVALPWDEEVAALREKWEETSPSLKSREEASVATRRSATTPPTAEVRIDGRESIPRLRVGLAEELTSIYLKPGGPFRVYATSEGIAELEPEERPERESAYLKAEPLFVAEEPILLHLSIRDGILRVSREDGAVLFTSKRPIRLIYNDPRRTTTLFNLTYGEGRFYGGREDRSYRGDIEALPRPGDRFTLVNELNVEEYLYSVVPSEMPAYWPAEALQAQAVAARSYTLRRRPRFRHRGFDLLSSVTSAHYRGVSGEDPRSTEAVSSTTGQVLRAGGRIIDAVYSANSAGYTESSESVWGGKTPLVGVSDPKLPELTDLRPPAALYDWILRRPDSYSNHPTYSSPSAYRWKLLVPREEIELQLRRRGEDIGTLRALLPEARGISGRVESVRLVGSDGETRITRDSVRSALGGLRSNLFVHSAGYSSTGRLEQILFEGAGWGHGVGLCQSGAAGMAADGYDAGEILSHYYPRATVDRLY